MYLLKRKSLLQSDMPFCGKTIFIIICIHPQNERIHSKCWNLGQHSLCIFYTRAMFAILIISTYFFCNGNRKEWLGFSSMQCLLYARPHPRDQRYKDKWNMAPSWNSARSQANGQCNQLYYHHFDVEPKGQIYISY